MGEPILHVVGSQDAGRRFDKHVAEVAGVSRALARRLVDDGAALIDGRSVAAATRVPEGATISIDMEPADDELAPFDVTVEIIYEDDDFLVVDKPAGLVVHPGAAHESDTLVNGLVGTYPELAGLGRDRNWGLVHRLDLDTSGLLIVARTPEAHAGLQDQLRRRVIERRYLALSTGREFDNATGTIDAPLGRDPKVPTRRAVIADGREAVTHYRRLATWQGAALLDVTLETGRTHQIRVHLAAIGAPIVGDATYGDAAGGSPGPGRTWLHAWRLALEHPVDGAALVLEAPLPEELAGYLAELGPPLTGALPR